MLYISLGLKTLWLMLYLTFSGTGSESGHRKWNNMGFLVPTSCGAVPWSHSWVDSMLSEYGYLVFLFLGLAGVVRIFAPDRFQSGGSEYQICSTQFSYSEL